LPERLEDTLAAPGARGSGHVTYAEGVFNGHRRYDRDGITPAYPFGFGLSYTSIELGQPTASSPTVAPGGEITVVVEARNVGDRPGSEVLQVYVRDVEASVPRPDRELRAFAKVHLEPGERAPVTLTIGPRDLAFWDTDRACWRAEAGLFELLVGRSSRDIVATIPVELTGEWTASASWWPPADRHADPA
jgi:beta-glucosidase